MGIGLHPQHFLKGWRLERAVRQLCHVQKRRLSVNNQSSMPCGQWCWRSGCVLAYQDQCFRVRLPTKTSCPFCSLRHLLWTSGFSLVSFLSLALSSLLLQIASVTLKKYLFHSLLDLLSCRKSTNGLTVSVHHPLSIGNRSSVGG